MKIIQSHKDSKLPNPNLIKIKYNKSKFIQEIKNINVIELHTLTTSTITQRCYLKDKSQENASADHFEGKRSQRFR